MAVTLNASLSAGLVQTADTSGNLSLQSGGTTILALTSAGAAVTGTLSATGTTTLGASSQGVQINRASDATAYGLVSLNGLDASTTACGMYGRGSGGDSGKLFITGIGTVVSQIAGVTVTSVSSTGLAVTGTLSSTGTASLCTTSGLVDIGTADVNIGYSKMLSILAPATTAGVLIQVQGSAYPCVANWSYDNAGDNTFQYFYANSAGDLKGNISFNRAAGLTAYSTTSDGTLKNIIGDAPQAKSLSILSNTRLREYSWKDDANNKPQIGVIAQELVNVFSGAVSVGGDVETTDAEGNVTTKYRPWTVDRTAYQFHLVAGWQNHESKIAALEARLAALETK